MHGHPVIPHQQITLLPFVAIGEVGLQAVFPELIENILAGRNILINDPGMEASPEEQRSLSSSRMGANDWVAGAGRLGQIAEQLVVGPKISPTVMT